VTASDEKIAAFAVEHSLAVVSADSDFATMLAISRGSAPSLVLFRSVDALAPRDQGEILAANLAAVREPLEAGAVVSLRRGHIRVRMLPLDGRP
jgi:predicted nuclease of predicted toxin-antitoxin system